MLNRFTMSPAELKHSAELRMAAIDNLSREWRLLVHEYGWTKIRQAIRAKKTAAQFAREQILHTLDFQL